VSGDGCSATCTPELPISDIVVRARWRECGAARRGAALRDTARHGAHSALPSAQSDAVANGSAVQIVALAPIVANAPSSSNATGVLIAYTTALAALVATGTNATGSSVDACLHALDTVLTTAQPLPSGAVAAALTVVGTVRCAVRRRAVRRRAMRRRAVRRRSLCPQAVTQPDRATPLSDVLAVYERVLSGPSSSVWRAATADGRRQRTGGAPRGLPHRAPSPRPVVAERAAAVAANRHCAHGDDGARSQPMRAHARIPRAPALALAGRCRAARCDGACKLVDL
jgi:hypothetical protein